MGLDLCRKRSSLQKAILDLELNKPTGTDIHSKSDSLITIQSNLILSDYPSEWCNNLQGHQMYTGHKLQLVVMRLESCFEQDS